MHRIGQSVRRAALDGTLDVVPVGPRPSQVFVANEPVEDLEVFERVSLHPRPQCLAHDGVEIDEQARPQHAVDLAFASRVTAHQALEGGRLVRREVVDVEIRVARPAFHDRVDEALEGAALLGAIEGPGIPVLGLGREPEQVLEATASREGVPLEVEEDVARRRCR